MKRDLVGALVIVGVFVFLMATRIKSPLILQTMAGSREISSLLLLSLIAYLYQTKYYASALVGALFAVYLLKTLWVTWPRSEESRLYVDIATDKARFDPSTSIDLQFANKSVTHNLPVLLIKPYLPDLLVFPPSSKVQEEMNGSD